MEHNFYAYQESLVPQKQQINAMRVVRYYYLSILLIFIHYICFFYLPKTVHECLDTPQVISDEKIVKYG